MWLWDIDIQTIQYLYKYLVESNEELYWVLPEQLPWLSSKSLQLYTNRWSVYQDSLLYDHYLLFYI